MADPEGTHFWDGYSREVGSFQKIPNSPTYFKRYFSRIPLWSYLFAVIFINLVITDGILPHFEVASYDSLFRSCSRCFGLKIRTLKRRISSSSEELNLSTHQNPLLGRRESVSFGDRQDPKAYTCIEPLRTPKSPFGAQNTCPIWGLPRPKGKYPPTKLPNHQKS